MIAPPEVEAKAAGYGAEDLLSREQLQAVVSIQGDAIVQLHARADGLSDRLLAAEGQNAALKAALADVEKKLAAPAVTPAKQGV